ncbi:MAG: amidohydrolase family protein [Acidobacteria bacterium]|nr:amidohydrolase family protein [Acidobacteriota bacterium]
METSRQNDDGGRVRSHEGGRAAAAGALAPTPAWSTLCVFASLTALAVASVGAQHSAAYVYAVTGARIVPVSAAPLDNATIVVRDGIIEAVSASATVPADAIVIQGKGLTVYPGLIDMGSSAGIELPAAPRADNPQTTEDVERAKTDALLRAHVRAADYLNPSANMLARMAAAGITSSLATPGGDAIRGQSALMNTTLGADEPQIGALADDRRAASVLRTPVALHVSFPERPAGGDAYPNSLMGVIAFVRQQFLDAQHYQAAVQFAEKSKRPVFTPYKAAYEAMQPALARRLPVAFRAEHAREILRALDMSKSFKLDPIITNGRESDAVAAELKAASARVIVSLNYPKRPESIAPEADEPLRTLRARANAPKTGSALEKAGVLFAFESDGLSDPKDFLKNAVKAVGAGLSRDAAVRALTMNAATIAGAADRIGSLEPGKMANLLVTDGDLFDDKTTIKHVFVAGRPARLDVAEPPRPGRTSER